MITLRIDGKLREVPEGTTVLDAAREAGVEIPTLCHLEGHPSHTSCMICVVREKTAGRLIPACSTRVQKDMDIETDSPEVREVRRGILELLLSEHVGDCTGPCQRVCPVQMDIPRVLRLTAAGRWDEAMAAVLEDCPLPGVLGRLCAAPCEKACRLGSVSRPVRICALKLFLVEKGSATPPPPAASSGRRVAVVGAGPTGLSAADYLARRGHAVALFDDHPEPGGMLRYGVSEEALPREALQADIDRILALGVTFRPAVLVGRDRPFSNLREEFDAVIVATGPLHEGNPLGGTLEMAGSGVRVGEEDWQSSLPGVFAGGGAVRPTHHAVRSVAQGRHVAAAVDRFLRPSDDTAWPPSFPSRAGRFEPGEVRHLMAQTPGCSGEEASDTSSHGHPPEIFTPADAQAEAGRCIGCACLKASTCKLRAYATRYGARPEKAHTPKRRPVERHQDHPDLVFEPGKCIKCGRCVRLAGGDAERPGMTFIGRGYDVRVGAPLDETVATGLAEAGLACAEACPTGALAPKPEETGNGAEPAACEKPGATGVEQP